MLAMCQSLIINKTDRWKTSGIDPERNLLTKGAKHVHTLEDLTISNLPDCYTFFSCKLWDMSALLEPNKESFSCVVLLKKADMAEM